MSTSTATPPESTWKALVRRAGRHGIRRLGWGVIDQAMSSLTNFAVVITVARSLGAEQFGAFGLAYVTYAFALNASRGLATDPLMVRFGDADLPTWRRAVPACTGTSLVAGLIMGAAVLMAATLMGPTTQGAFLALGLSLPGLLLQDGWRFAFFALGRGSRSFINDVVWAVTLLPTLVLLQVTGNASAFAFVMAWGAAAYVAAAVGVLQSRLVPRPLRARAWLSEHRDLSYRYMVEGTASSAAHQLRTYGVGLLLGLAAVGYLQAASTLMGPFMIVFLGTGTVIVPEVVRVLRRSPRHLPLVCLLIGSGLAVIGLGWGAVLLAALPQGLGDFLLGDIWRPTYELIPLVILAVLGGCLQGGAGTGLHALGASRRSLRAMLLSSAVYLILTLAGAVFWGLIGTVAGAAAAAWLGAWLWWWQLRAAFGESEFAAHAGRWLPRRQRTGQVAQVEGSNDMAETSPLVIATVLPPEGITGVHTHFHQLRRYLEGRRTPAVLITPFSWVKALVWPVFALRLPLHPFSGSASVWWYRYWHEIFLYRALRRYLADAGDCVVYAQCPVAARATLRARRGPHQRVVMAVHSSISQADEWASKEIIPRDGRVFRGIRGLESDVIPRVDGLIYVSSWAQEALASWFPTALTVPSVVIPNFVAPLEGAARPADELGDLVTVGGLEKFKNHRYMLRVLAAANRAGRSFTLDVFGEGPERPQIQRLIQSLGLEKQVRLHGFRRDVRAALPGYRAYVHASYTESSSLAIIEAMAAGLPIVAGKIGPIGELVDDGVEGRFWPLDDPDRAAQVLISLVDSAPERARAADAAKARFRRDFDAEGIAPRLVSFLSGTAPEAEAEHAGSAATAKP